MKRYTYRGEQLVEMFNKRNASSVELRQFSVLSEGGKMAAEKGIFPVEWFPWLDGSQWRDTSSRQPEKGWTGAIAPKLEGWIGTWHHSGSVAIPFISEADANICKVC